MAVYTDIAVDELQAYLGDYELGELLAYKGIAEGVENSNFLLHTSRGYFILTLYEKRVAAKDVPFFLSLLEHLAARGLTCPQPIKTRKGEALGHAGRPAGGDLHLPRRHVDQAAERRSLSGLGRGAGAAASRRPRFPAAAAQHALGRWLADALSTAPRVAPTR